MKRHTTLWLMTACVAVFIALSMPSNAAAFEDGCQGDGTDIMAWTIATFEAGFAGSLALRFSGAINPEKNGGEAILQAMPWASAAVFAVSAWCLELSHEPAMAIHGALWTGFDFFLLGAIVDGVDGKGGELGMGTVVLTSIGVLAGGIFGAAVISEGTNDNESWGWYLATPPIAAAVTVVAEGAFAIVDFVASDGRNFDSAFIPLAFGIITAGIATTAVSSLIMEDAFAATDDHDPALRLAESLPPAKLMKLSWTW